MNELRIELYQPVYLRDFVRLNLEWIQTFFHLESSDRVVLNDPERYILKQGGQIFFAVNGQGKPVGCCALIKHAPEGYYELAKMAVSPQYQGRGIGTLLGEALLAYAREHEVRKIVLEGNTRLASSIALYRKLGFQEVPNLNAAYERCNIKMELNIV
ncbi:ribosomal protein S18 acetylase RimI-like enzyme [Bacteroides reticulotermitis]|uniref:Ribosomal protein S18 acetylase RimI-like enzyme n=1 Tax=Bacteroides reticulotermitis TaxID=1133319 RepID=A0A840CUC8_9BACE|nr:GNAT family N-acetyltransferase [Bacteroides reticulotermitis]MBB4042916.1 ribosomal protein S18 acetylase RimI-like enzyme [Bacteroides reticulotermitis]HJD76856.1 GNAT family N-acetyltransferase [Bacteroides reticulotermitis]